MIEEPKDSTDQDESTAAADQSPPEPASAVPAKSPGLYLSDAREHLGLNRAKIGQKLGLTETAVRDLEKNLFDRFPSNVYVRGYLKNYAKILGEDELALIEIFDQYCLEHNLDSGRSSMVKPPRKTGPSNKAKALFALVSVALAASIYAIFRYFA